MKKILFVLCGFPMGGIETYVLRLAKELHSRGISVDLLLLSAKYDEELLNQAKQFANVLICEKTPLSQASSWINAFLKHDNLIKKSCYDLVHVIDILTLGFVLQNKKTIQFKKLSIGIYHAKEIVWWRGRDVYFRKKLLEIYDKNVELSLFPNEAVAASAAHYTQKNAANFHIVPLGIDLARYAVAAPNKQSKKIISVGRLVDFKVYNRHIISQLPQLREIADLEYYIYGDGSEEEHLRRHAINCGVEKFVHFKGAVAYQDLPSIFNDAFCFIGSGTTIIEASAAGIPSIVGIESIEEPVTCGFFSEIKGYSYNESSATTIRKPLCKTIAQLLGMSLNEYIKLSEEHRKKAAEFDIKTTTSLFLEKSNYLPNFNIRFSRWRALFSLAIAILRFGPKSLRSRMHN